MSFQELIGFLSSPSPEISRVALENVLPFTPSSASRSHLFCEHDYAAVKALKKLAAQTEDSWSAQNAIIALINLTDNSQIRAEVAGDLNAIKNLVSVICGSPKPTYLKFAAMLLNNISRETETLAVLQGPLLSALVLTTAKTNNVNDNDYDFVVCAFAEFARQDATVMTKNLPQMYAQLTSRSLNRRKAVASVIKNTLFRVEAHETLAADTPLIEAIMVSLMGPEEIDKDDFAELPPIVQKEFSTTKVRESDAGFTLLLVECLLLLSSSQSGRNQLREKRAYYIVRELHKATNDPDVTMACENFANMVMRGDPNEPKITPVDEDSEDDIVEEVV